MISIIAFSLVLRIDPKILWNFNIDTCSHYLEHQFHSWNVSAIWAKALFISFLMVYPIIKLGFQGNV